MIQWDEMLASLRSELDGRHEAREAALRESRLAIQNCSRAIKSAHRADWEAAEKGLAEAKARLDGARAVGENHPEVVFAGHLQDAEKEYVEGRILVAMLRNEPLPLPSELGVAAPVYLNGIAEAASECRRSILDLMRRGDLDEAERLQSLMERVQDELALFDYPDGVTGGLRRTNDALRAVVERTRSDLALTRVQSRLIEELKRNSAGQTG